MADRRTVLKVLSGGCCLATAGLATAPALGLLAETPPEQGGRGQWLRALRLDTLEAGVSRKVALVGSETDAWTRASDRRLGSLWLLREGDSVRAWSAVCPHLGCAIERGARGFTCPCHDSDFGPHGDTLSGPSPRGMDPLPTRIEEGWVLVQYKRYRLGVSQREEV